MLVIGRSRDLQIASRSLSLPFLVIRDSRHKVSLLLGFYPFFKSMGMGKDDLDGLWVKSLNLGPVAKGLDGRILWRCVCFAILWGVWIERNAYC